MERFANGYAGLDRVGGTFVSRENRISGELVAAVPFPAVNYGQIKEEFFSDMRADGAERIQRTCDIGRSDDRISRS